MGKEVAVTATIHFNDGSRLAVRWPRRPDVDPATIASRLRAALETPQVTFVIDGDLLIVPMSSVKYLHITPAPELLPGSVISRATIEAEGASFSIEK